jgi:phage baseplate assembly protein V
MALNTGGVSFKTAIVKEARPGFARVVFPDIDDFVSAWLPIVMRKTLRDKECFALDEGEHVACVLDENFEDGVVLGAIYSDAEVPPVESGDKLRFQFFDGGSFEYDRSSGKLAIVTTGDVDVQAGGQIALHSPSQVTIDAPTTRCTGDMIVEKKLTFLGGMSGSGGEGNTMEIDGSMKINNGDVVVDDISVKQHHHEYDDGNTSEAKA